MGELRGTHVPVLLERCLELLDPALRLPGAVHVDFTLGLGGHAEAVLERYPDVVLVGLDRDTEALAHSRHRLARFGERVKLVHAVYDELPRVLGELDLAGFHSGLFDLGVSSLQLDEADRGFAYAQDAPLDMRMDQTSGITAEQVVNEYEPGELVRILRQYGEEKFAQRVVSSIVRERQRGRITSTARLSELVKESIPAAARRTGGNPAKRTFQALRIEVNGELATLEAAVPEALDALAPKGRLVVMSYQSLEDRIVKRALTARSRSTGPVDLPVELPGTGPTLRLLTRGSEPPSEQEVAANPRAASVKLRAVERIDQATPGAARERPRLTTTHGGQGRLRPGEREEGEGKA
ncbi:ribosomal RNA small subunit methyltransferase H [Paractinoplanes abujensis]|uniref:Ribosomal RNA small subunit methyltransferase H n=1 Tax=Paractinoplanes abujensis TaxID=882441 RepID=A0A7W7CTC6_9ACTN|nr:16S rRNA (cytosine(1402)-N(4))-methyltransferase RsmH [Actinoplanes abujensis]MBB4694318.1 16S rRNA (cytosine1402-N4)-methyltransferase [Actinoplanes abujensis]GID20468.1 ribosomal RNA small subunit methyltransferase H [Actinoplanes abujensis]